MKGNALQVNFACPENGKSSLSLFLESAITFNRYPELAASNAWVRVGRKRYLMFEKRDSHQQTDGGKGVLVFKRTRERQENAILGTFS